MEVDVEVICRCLWLCVFLLLAQAPSGAVRPIADVPFDLVRGAMFVKVMINDKGPYTFLVDTGATACAITPEVADEYLQLPRAGEMTVSTMGSIREVPVALMSRISVGMARADNLKALLIPDNGLSQFAGRRVDGVLGASFLWRSPVQFDFPAQRLRFYPATHDISKMTADAPWAGHTTLKLKGAPNSPSCAALMRVALNGSAPRWLMLDTGANSLVLREATAQQVKARSAPFGSTSISALGPRRNSKYWLLDSVRVAGLTVENVQAHTPIPWGDWTEEQLGTDALDQFRVTIDVSRKIARLERDRVPDRFGDSPWGVGLLVVPGDTGARVTTVRPGSDAALQGIAADDVLEMVDDQEASTLAEEELNGALKPPPGSSVVVLVRSADSGVRRVSLTSRRYVRMRSTTGDGSVATQLMSPGK